MKTQTAVEWLTEKITYDNGFGQRLISFKETLDLTEYLEQAKKIEKLQIIDAHNNGKNILPPNENGDQYYNEIYKQGL